MLMIAPLYAPEHAPVIHVLHLEDSLVDQKLAARALAATRVRCAITCVDTLEAFVQHLRTQPVDVVIADYYLPGFTAVQAWHAAQPRPKTASCVLGVEGEGQDLGDVDERFAPHHTHQAHAAQTSDAPDAAPDSAFFTPSAAPPPFVLLSGAIGEAAAVEAIRLGMADYVLKDDIARLPHVVERALEVARARAREAAAQARLAASQRQLAALTEHLQQSIESERAAIAREIHDDIGGSLTAVKFELAWLLRHASDERARERARSSLQMLEHALGASQRIMQNLRPPVLDAGLVAAIQWLAQDFERRHATRVHFSASATEVAASAAIQIVAYRTAQEALTNIAKYASASKVWVEIADGEGALTVEIRDNGAGMSAATLAKIHAGHTDAFARGGFGLRGLAERARTVGGWLDVSSRPQRGTSVILTVPLNATTTTA